MLLAVPLLGSGFGEGDNYYEVTVEGVVVGAVSDPETAESAFLTARARIAQEADALVLADAGYELERVHKIFASTMEEEELTEVIYEELVEVASTAKTKAYLVKINEFTVTLASYQDVMDLLYATKDKYDTENEFEISIVTDSERELNVYTVEVTKRSTDDEEEDSSTVKGVAAVTGASAGIGVFDVTTAVEDVITQTVTEEVVEEESSEDETVEVTEDGLRELYFAEKVEIAEAYVYEDSITDTDEAIELVTKETAKNEIYEVQSGDTLSQIANDNGLYVSELLELNEDIDESTTLHPGDELIITVPQPELSVVTVEESTYEEYYNADVEYVYNDDWYTTESEVLQEAEEGYREVTALITSENGKEESREVIAQTVYTEAVPEIIEIGTQTPPTYIKPISGGTLTSTFKWRWGRMHKGVDWSCSVGTSVMASSGGTVTQAGWYSGYGYCITISHPDGKQTRYGHLSKILVSVGQTVAQGEKIALSGNTGNSTGPHLHFEIIVNGSQVDPLPYLE